MASSEIRGIVYQDEASALAACVALDVALDLPNEHMTRWTEPVRLVDGWLVQQPDGSGEIIARERLYVEVEENI